MQVEVVPAPARSDLTGLVEHYLRDLNEATGHAFTELPHLDLYWTDTDRYPFLILAGGTAAGFGLVRRLGPGLHQVAEFFVLQRFRRQGIGTRAALDLFRRFPGTWHVSELPSNEPALRFWRKTIGEITGGRYEERPSDDDPRDPMQVFRIHRLELEVDDHTTLRTRSLGDVEPLFTLIDTNRAHLRRWLPWLDGVDSPADTRARTERLLVEEEAGGHLALLIESGGELGGMVSFDTIDQLHRSAELGFWLRDDWQGRGIVTRCCAALIEHGFGTLELNRVHAGAAVENSRSRAVVERLGFGQYGISPEAEWLYDHFVDHACYVLLRRDWEATRS